MWFTENAWPPVLICAIVAILFGVWGLRPKQKKWLLGAVLFLIAIPVLFVVERSIETPAEEIEKLVLALRDAVVANDIDATLNFLSEQAATERAIITTGMAMGRLEPDASITDLDVQVTENATAQSHFRANGTFHMENSFISGNRHVATRWRLFWRREAGEWKIYGIDRLDPIKGDKMELLSPE